MNAILAQCLFLRYNYAQEHLTHLRKQGVGSVMYVEVDAIDQKLRVRQVMPRESDPDRVLDIDGRMVNVYVQVEDLGDNELLNLLIAFCETYNDE